ncbi:MAG TPA: cache domain-containing protein [Methanoregulaceae archaeon]|nr:cache domain-containing protein [Methanoregulaceae archaeon]
MRIRDYFFIIALIAVAVLVAGCSQTPQSGAGTPVQSGPAGTPVITTPGTASTTGAPATVRSTKDLITFVRGAVNYAHENGRDKAIAVFNDPKGQFVTGSLYVFAEDFNGQALAEPFQHNIVGTSIRNITDPFGVPIVRNLIETAGYGTGYVSYEYPNPLENYTIEPKLSVVSDVDGTYYIGAGLYSSQGDIYPSVKMNLSGTPHNEEELVAYVRAAAAYARANGKEKAVAVFNSPDSPFNRGELVVMAFDYNGTNLVSPPYSPEVSANHINLINYHDPDGVATIRGMRDLSQNGGGFLYTVAKVTVNGTDVYVPKIDYAEPVDGTWWLFSGITVPGYTEAIQGNLTEITIRNHTKIELYDLVTRVVTFARANGKEKTLAAINDPHGPFVNGDLFVWAESTNGTLLADPFLKTAIGQDLINYTDAYGMKTTQAGIMAMQNGTGFSHALFPDTAFNGSSEVPKLIYQKPVDDTWFIGSGVYGVEVTNH